MMTKKILILTLSLLTITLVSKAQVEIVSGGTSTAYTVAVPGTFLLTNGLQVTFKAHIACSAAATLNVSGSGNISIKKEGGVTALVGGDIKVNQIVTVAYDGTNWQMLSALGSTPTAPTNYWSVNGTDIYNNNTSEVGIGKATPVSTLDVSGDVNSDDVYKLDGTTFLSNWNGNVLVGYTLATSLTGIYNTFIGEGAGQNTTTPARNTFLGRYAGNSNITGSDNTSLGAQAASVANSSYNTSIGAYSNTGLTSGQYNVSLGYSTGQINTTGSYNTFLGYNADATATNNNLTNATAIGSNAKVGQSNSLVLGGTGADIVNVGIGTTMPNERLHVVGDINVTNAIKLNGSSGTAGQVLTSGGAGGADTWSNPTITTTYWSPNGSDIFNNNAGAVLVGGSNIDGAYKVSFGKDASSVEKVLSLTNSNNFVGGGTSLGFRSNFGGTMWDQALISGITGAASASGDLAFSVMKNRATTTMVEAMRIQGSTGNVGIGTSTPSVASKLHVVGAGNGSTVNIEDNTLSNGSLLYLSSTSTIGTGGNNSRAITINRSGANSNATHTAYGIQSNITNTGVTSTNIAGYFYASGGTTNHAIQLVDGSEANNRVLASDAAGMATWTDLSSLTSGGATAWTKTGTSIYPTSSSTDKVAIGTTNPSNNNLYVFRPNTAFGAGYSNIYGYRQGSATATNGGTSWAVGSVDAAVKGYSDYGNNYTAGVAGYMFLDYNNSAGVFGSNQAGTIYGALAIKDNAGTSWAGYFGGSNVYIQNNLGIGTTNPLFPLEINTSTLLRGSQIQNSFSSATAKYGIYALASGGGAGDNNGGWFDASGAGTGINYGVGAQALGTAGENRAVYGNAIGGTTNWAGYFGGGNVYIQNNLGIGTTAPSQKLEVVGNVVIPAANDYQYKTAKTKYINVHPYAFVLQAHSASTPGIQANSFSPGNSWWINDGTLGTIAYFNAPVFVPEGATITGFEVYYWDANATYDVSAVLRRQPVGVASVFTIMNAGSSTGSSATLQTLSATGSYASSTSDMYFIQFTTVEEVSTSNLRLYGARVTYTVTKAD